MTDQEKAEIRMKIELEMANSKVKFGPIIDEFWKLNPTEAAACISSMIATCRSRYQDEVAWAAWLVLILTAVFKAVPMQQGLVMGVETPEDRKQNG